MHHNLRIKPALLCVSVDERLKNELRSNCNSDIKHILSDDCFWKQSMGVASLLKPICTGIQHCEGDNVCVSVMPCIWKHIEAKLDDDSLKLYGFDSTILVSVSEKQSKTEKT